MKPAVAIAACTAGALIDASSIRCPSARIHSSPVIVHGHAGSSNCHRCARRGPSTTSRSKAILRLAVFSMNARCSRVIRSRTCRLPVATALIRPFSSGIENDADLTRPFSLASASILKSRNLRHTLLTDAGSTGRSLTVLSWSPPTVRRARTMIPASWSSSAGRVKEVDVALFVIVRREPVALERCLDLAIRDRRLDLDRVRTGHCARYRPRVCAPPSTVIPCLLCVGQVGRQAPSRTWQEQS